MEPPFLRHVLCCLLLVAVPAQAIDCVVFIHGLWRTSGSLQKMADAFEDRGYVISMVDYPSREQPIEELAPLAVESGLAQCPAGSRVNFVTHSMGGILVRYYLKYGEVPNLGRVVMLAPPNQGSEVVDDYREVPGFEIINGPAGMQLGTGDNSVPVQLGPVDFELGVIAGTGSFNPILSQSLPNPDDGKVSVESTRVDGMADFVTVPNSHAFIMRAPQVIEYAINFVETGRFAPAGATTQVLAGEQGPREAVLAVVEQFLHAINTGDRELMARLSHEEGMNFVRAQQDDGSYRTHAIPQSLVTDPGREARPPILERIWDPVVLVNDQVAMVWAPYDLYQEQEFSHCGIDLFNLIKEDGDWKIANSSWTQQRFGCGPSPLGPPEFD